MLVWLNIQNFAIVSSLELECPDKMSAFTGETGAGKSIMIDALSILLGARADSNILRPDADKCDLAACFHFDEDSNIDLWLIEQELKEQAEEVLIRRQLNKEGRSKYFINGRAVTGQQVKTLGEMLLHIHGQHEQQSLLSAQTHREHLDNFSNAKALKQAVKTAYLERQDAASHLEKLNHIHQSHEQIQLWQYQISELEELNPQVDELDKIYQEHHLLNHAKQYLQASYAAEELISESEGFSIEKGLSQILHQLQLLPQDNKNVANILQLIDAAMIQIEEAKNELKYFKQSLEIDPERLNILEERMSRWHLLARKLQVDAKELPEQKEKLARELKSNLNLDLQKQEAELALKQAEAKYLEAALALRQHRQNHAPDLATAIEHIIQELGMPHAKLSIQIEALSEMHVHGMDKVEYMIASNPGSQAGPIHKIASGGELSRISLSIHLITAQRGATPTLLFDEVDVGIGGATARKVGQRLRELGERLQIFCVTHQPQVASLAHHQFLVSKTCDHAQTFSSIQKLDEAGRIQEIARMLGGISISEQSKNNAKELLNIL